MPLVRCAFCKSSGEDRFRNDACRVCGGSGQMMVAYDNAVKCGFCKGSGEDKFRNDACRTCKGAGVMPPGLQEL